jgi:hypothetical protein
MKGTEHWLALIIGFLVASPLAGPVIGFAVDSMWRRIGWSGNSDQNIFRLPWLPSTLGIVERGLYLLSFVIQHPEFLAFWITMKVAGQWSQWSTDQVLKDGRRMNGRAVFQIFLLGNAFSILYAFLGYQIFRWLVVGNGFAAIVVGAAVFVGTFAFGLWHRWQANRTAV